MGNGPNRRRRGKGQRKEEKSQEFSDEFRQKHSKRTALTKWLTADRGQEIIKWPEEFVGDLWREGGREGNVGEGNEK